MSIREERRILQVARGTHPEVSEGYSQGMDLSELCGLDGEAGRRAANRKMVARKECLHQEKETHKSGRRPSYY